MARIEIRLAPNSEELRSRTYSGFLRAGPSFRPLPFGSTLDTEKGVFSWMVHPVFHGEYELVFTENILGKPVSKKVIRVRIGEEGDSSGDSFGDYLGGGNYGGEDAGISHASINELNYARLAAEAAGTRRESFTKSDGNEASPRDSRGSGRGDLDRVATIQTLVNTYYFYSYDGKLLAEYDHTGACVRDYIYFGNTFLAEFLPQQSKYYYYTSDQVNSVRMITDDNGTVVYSAAHAPYGQIQQTWVSTYQPKLQFSGKEREAETGLDYFGARYYANGQYRFISVDPIINREGAITNPQLWNLYSYCRNSPLTFLDPDGRTELTFDVRTGRLYVDPQVEGQLPYWVPATSGSGVAMNNPSMEKIKDVGPIPRGKYEINADNISNPSHLRDWVRNLLGDWGDWRVKIEPKPGTETFGRSEQFLHGGKKRGSKGCVDIGGGKFGNENTDRVLRDLKRDPDRIIPLNVQ